ncbi:U4/U6 small nuclear ribonucleoprotein prp4 [Irineochytrium annulatum]|nr:U4/U6 small nuclear ribonucleoprotein prp4 [Irineochytrium annulatum]
MPPKKKASGAPSAAAPQSSRDGRVSPPTLRQSRMNSVATSTRMNSVAASTVSIGSVASTSRKSPRISSSVSITEGKDKRGRKGSSAALRRSAAGSKNGSAMSLPGSGHRNKLAAFRGQTVEEEEGEPEPRRLSPQELTLMKACEVGDIDEVYKCIWKETDVNCRKPIYGTSPLSVAFRNGHSDICEVLMSFGAILDGDEYGATPVHWAAGKGQDELLKKMLRHRIAVNDLQKRDLFGSTPLHFASVSNLESTVQVLINAGSDALITNNDGRKASDITSSDAIRDFLHEAEIAQTKAQTAARNKKAATEMAAVLLPDDFVEIGRKRGGSGKKKSSKRGKDLNDWLILKGTKRLGERFGKMATTAVRNGLVDDDVEDGEVLDVPETVEPEPSKRATTPSTSSAGKRKRSRSAARSVESDGHRWSSGDLDRERRREREREACREKERERERGRERGDREGGEKDRERGDRERDRKREADARPRTSAHREREGSHLRERESSHRDRGERRDRPRDSPRDSPRDPHRRSSSRYDERDPFLHRKGSVDHRHRDRLGVDLREENGRYSNGHVHGRNGDGNRRALNGGDGREERHEGVNGNGKDINGDTVMVTADASKEAEEPMAEVEEEKTEEQLIEERRKRRMAILQKHKLVDSVQRAVSVDVDPSPMAIDSVQPVSEALTKAAAVADPAPLALPVQSPQAEEVHADSPFALDKADKADKAAGEKDGAAAGDQMSAADYDPNMDKLEDEHRLERAQHRVKDSNVNPDQSTLHVVDNAAADDGAGADGGEADMFAEDDMFAPAGDGVKKEVANILESKPVVRASDNPALIDNWDDPDGYYRAMPREVLDNGRYIITAIVGRGVFSSVVKALDTKNNNAEVAIKIIRNNDTMYRAGIKEIGILKKLMAADPDDKKHVIRMLRNFEHRNHLCMVFESLRYAYLEIMKSDTSPSLNLRELLKKYRKGLNIKAVRVYAQQLFMALSLLKKCTILHADIKPDNILASESKNTLKLCDLGSAGEASENEITPYLVSRFYRAPEIILGMPYDYAIDMFSVGCTLYELFTGKILFPGRSNNQMLRMFMELKGKFSNKMLRKGQFTSQHFDEQMNFLQVEQDKITKRDVVKKVTYTKPTKDLKSRLLPDASERVPEEEMKMITNFIDLLERCLHLGPDKRLTVSEAMQHPFIRG